MLNLLAVLLSLEPGMLSACIAGGAQHWLAFRLPSTVYQDPQVLFCRAAPQPASPRLYHCKELFHPRLKTLHLSLLNFIRFLPVHFPVQLELSEWQPCSDVYQSATLPPHLQFGVIQKPYEGALCLTTMHLSSFCH